MKKPTKPKRGRPKSRAPLAVTYGVRLTTEDAEEVRVAAQKREWPVGQWLRKAVFLALGRES